MKTKKILLIATVFFFTLLACTKVGAQNINSATELKAYIDKQPANSPDKPIKVAMKVNDRMIWDISKVISEADKYVSLDLSGSPLTAIPGKAFYECETLVGITIPNSVTNIGEEAFYSCENLTSVTIGNNVTSIGVWAFFCCYSLTSVTIPNSVTNIGNDAFSKTGLTSITIPNSVTNLDEEAFDNCDDLTSITVDSGNPNYASEGGILYNKAKTRLIRVPEGISGAITILASVTSIGKGAVNSCDKLTSITLPSGVTSIGDYAFYACENITSITIPASVTTIGKQAFRYWTSSQTINIQGRANMARWSGNWNDGCNAKINYLGR